MIQDFVELVGYLDKKFAVIDSRFEAINTYFQENTMLGHQVNRHEWKNF